MKKINKKTYALLKSLAFTIVLLLCITGLIACSDETKSNTNSFDANPFTPIEEYKTDGLVYMNLSKTVYILYSEPSTYGGYGYLAPYIQNGHFCEYIDGEIVEIINSNDSSDSSNSLSPDEIWDSLSDEEKESLIKND